MRFALAGLVAAITLVSMAAFAQQERENDRPRDGERRDGDRRDGDRRDGDRGRFGGGNVLMEALDKDKNGEISQSELSNAVVALKALDKNKDGKLTREEMTPDFAGQMIARMLENDKNKDGKLAKDEVSERMRDGFDNADTNKDGQLDQAELRAMMARFRGQGGQGGRRPGDGDRRPSEDGDRPSRPRPESEAADPSKI